ncbi:hypothetical protein TCAL_01732 [Tigriopus californicus]|uniref:Solute carrier family 12 member 9 n=1 Tax=Tigriopus californicus TaxID=6832 RepID=A0A553PKY2_TIGCA|nr:solute carrier family 12 member 9-like [Tigriopus californicus]TRY78351.1 hypothetical protein TCAL_01732 [Tigriopus californicus]|eukprot:TCALIF_01732-PA protein Name:"Similar to slc12a9 Solute carrier family 12 member 9 (Danio rerio)" AED:0.03 eAED:0.03 QI:0/-1/0/1/-1/1/1/0/926
MAAPPVPVPTMEVTDETGRCASIQFDDQSPLLAEDLDHDDFDEDGEEIAHLVTPFVGLNRTLGTFAGVFCPVSLSMFSTLLFLRVGYIVGNAGLLVSLGSLALSYGILCLTVLSISAIASNGALEAGGVYFMISRTLGAELGGAVGVLFFWANVFASALYATGCVEGLVNNFTKFGVWQKHFLSEKWFDYMITSLINGVNLLICMVGAHMFGRTSGVLLLVVVIATLLTIGSYVTPFAQDFQYNRTVCETNCTPEVFNGSFSGLVSQPWSDIVELTNQNLMPAFQADCEDSQAEVSFSTVFAVLFSGVTGIMAGANMSGDLKKPARSIPYGTLSACAFTGSIYTIVFILTAMTCDRGLLYYDCQFMSEFVFFKPIVAIGTVVTTFCASTSSLIGASRVLYALGKDSLFGAHLSPWLTKTMMGGNPYLAVIFTYICVQLILLVGSLNQIAKLCSLLFLLSYMVVNLACLGLEWAKPPSFRPSFDYFHVGTCIIGAVSSGGMMFALSLNFSLVCIVLLVFIMVLFHIFRTNQNDWGSLSQGIIFHTVRKYLLLLHPNKRHVKYWRPHILLLVGNVRKSCALMDFTNAMKKSGMYFIGHVVMGDINMIAKDPVMGEMSRYQSVIDKLKIKAFVEVTLAKTLREGIQNLICLAGLGVMKPNTIMMGFPRTQDDEIDELKNSQFADRELDDLFPALQAPDERSSAPTASEYLSIVGDVIKLGKNLCIYRHFQQLNHSSLFPRNRLGRTTRPTEPIHMDVWLVDFFSGPNTTLATNCTTFILTMASLVTRVSRWKHLTLRVLIRSPQDEAAAVELSDKLDLLLTNIRINTKRVRKDLNISQTEAGGQLPSRLREGKAAFDILSISDDYMKAMNERIVSSSIHSAVTIISLNRPPYRNRSPEVDQAYMRLLQILTKDLPPTLLIYGIDNVISN